MAFTFNQEAITEAEEDYSKLQVSAEQRPIIEGVANVLSNYVNISKIALKGFIWRVVKDWQKKHSKAASEIATMNPEDRVKNIGEMFDMLNDYLAKILRSSDQKAALSEAIDDGFEFYKSEFAQR